MKHLVTGIIAPLILMQNIAAQNESPNTNNNSMNELIYNVSTKDVVRATIVWSVINRDDKENEALFSAPLEANSLIDVLLNGINAYKFNAYYPYTRISGDELGYIIETKQEKSDVLPRFYFGDFEFEMTPTEVKMSLGVFDETGFVLQQNQRQAKKETVEEATPEYAEIQQIMIKELWVYRKDRGRIQKFLIGMAPVRIYKETGEFNKTKKIVFWVYYSDIKQILSNTQAYLAGTQAGSYSLNDILYYRLFSSNMVREITKYRDKSFEEEIYGIEAAEKSADYQKNINKSVYNLYDY